MRSGIDKTAFMWMWPVKGSSNVRAVGYDRRKKELGIRFNSSPQKYIYSDVPISIYKELVQAPSRGKYVHQHIKGYYPYRRKDYTGEEFAWEEEMPSKSQKQQRYFGWLYAKKKSGDTSGMSPKDIKTMESMSKEQIRDFAATKRKGLPTVLKKEAASRAPRVASKVLGNYFDLLTGRIRPRLRGQINAMVAKQEELAESLRLARSRGATLDARKTRVFEGAKNLMRQWAGEMPPKAEGLERIRDHAQKLKDVYQRQDKLMGRLNEQINNLPDTAGMQNDMRLLQRRISIGENTLDKINPRIWTARALTAGVAGVPIAVAANRALNKNKGATQ